ncbi:hypothetical protein BRC83_09450 [Halobacteriales archaeon QS_1_68_17]|nr:MAG: hypothetical protein BRC83_09450 [Halobacteriales archaeon QS_1_68_17]
MDCPRCGAQLLTYSLDERTAFVCEDCGYVGVPADHEPEPEPEESWGEALERFYDRFGAGDAVDGVAVTIDGRAYDVPPGVFERYEDLTAAQRAIVDELVAESEPTDPERSHAEIAAAAGVSRSYVRDVLDSCGDLAAAIADGRVD